MFSKFFSFLDLKRKFKLLKSNLERNLMASSTVTRPMATNTPANSATKTSDGLRTVVVEDTLVTRIYFEPKKQPNMDEHSVEAKLGEPMTYYTVTSNDKMLHCNAENGALIIVLPAALPKGDRLEMSREDDADDHQVTIQAESGKINGHEKVYLRPKGSGDYSRIKLTKDARGDSNNWTIA